MSLAIVHSRALVGISAPQVTVEAHLSNGLPSLSIVGLPETVVRESRERVRSALLNAGMEFPNRRITINLAPADLPKQGSRFDLPIAVAILAASGQIPLAALENLEFVGELALSGQIRSVGGVLPSSQAASESHRAIMVPTVNAAEAALVKKTEVYPVKRIIEVIAHLNNEIPLAVYLHQTQKKNDGVPHPDIADVIGQSQARRALEIAAAGAHNLLFIGPPGTGKTMLASRLPGLLPQLGEEEALEVATIRSCFAGGDLPDLNKCFTPPFRAPHHSASPAALVGGGNPPQPGEVSLAHRGVLFLDEFPEYQQRVLDVLREPLENGHITIARAKYHVNYPCKFQLLAAMNPCPCGYYGDTEHHCNCSEDKIRRYQGRISGPLLDRIDIHLRLNRERAISFHPVAGDRENSATVAQRIQRARKHQLKRGCLNSEMKRMELERYCQLDFSDQRYLELAARKFSLSLRACHRILRLARTIADLEDETADLQHRHLQEALSYRGADIFT